MRPWLIHLGGCGQALRQDREGGSKLDLLELFERDTPGRGHSVARQPRRGLRGLFDRMTSALGGGDVERDNRGHHRERRRRNDQDFGFD